MLGYRKSHHASLLGLWSETTVRSVTGRGSPRTPRTQLRGSVNQKAPAAQDGGRISEAILGLACPL